MKRKLLLLSFLIMALVFALKLSSKTEAVTIDACTNCFPTYQSCATTCSSDYNTCLFTGTHEDCIPAYASCINSCAVSYQSCIYNNCVGGTSFPNVQSGVGYDYYCAQYQQNARDQCIAGTVFVEGYEECQQLEDNEACCQQKYMNFIDSLQVCYCNLDPRNSNCLISPVIP